MLDELIRRYPEGVSALVRGLRYVEPNIRTQCAQVLVLLHEKKKEKLPKGAVLGLIDLVGKDKNEHVRALGAKALGSSKDERFADVLELALQSDRSGPVRAAAAKSLGELRAKKAIPSLIRALSDRETEVRMYAANSLRKMKAKEAVSQLVQLLGDPNSIVRARAHKALQEITGKNLPVSGARVKKLFADQTKFEADKVLRAGFTPRIPLGDAITTMVDWYVERGQYESGEWHQPPRETVTLERRV